MLSISEGNLPKTCVINIFPLSRKYFSLAFDTEGLARPNLFFLLNNAYHICSTYRKLASVKKGLMSLKLPDEED